MKTKNELIEFSGILLVAPQYLGIPFFLHKKKKKGFSCAHGHPAIILHSTTFLQVDLYTQMRSL